MNKFQNSSFRMHAAVKATASAHAAAWSAFPSFSEPWAEFVVLLDEVDTILGKQGEVISGATLDKENLRNDLTARLLHLGNAFAMLAQINEDPELKRDGYWSKGRLQKMKAVVLIGHAEKMGLLAADHAAGLIPLGIDAAFLSDLDAAKLSFVQIWDKPKHLKMSRQDATQKLATTLSKMRSLLRDKLDVAARLLSYDHPEFYSEYQSSRKLIDPARRRRALTVQVLNAKSGKPLAGVLAVVGDDIKKKTGPRGKFYVQHLAQGKHSMIFTKEKFQTETVEFETDGRTGLSLVIRMRTS